LELQSNLTGAKKRTENENNTPKAQGTKKPSTAQNIQVFSCSFFSITHLTLRKYEQHGNHHRCHAGERRYPGPFMIVAESYELIFALKCVVWMIFEIFQVKSKGLDRFGPSLALTPSGQLRCPNLQLKKRNYSAFSVN